MEILISSYDYFLIYHPNIFFPALFLSCILGVVILIMGIIYARKKYEKIVKEIKSNLSKVGTKNKDKYFFRMKMVNISFYAKFIGDLFIGINKLLKYFLSKIERVLKRIGKEILIDE